MRSWEVWKLAARPRTLPASTAPVVAGTAIAFSEGGFRFLPALAALAVALLLQIGANLANDYFDFFKGADTHERLGPLRVTQAGLAKPGEMRAAMALVFGLAAMIGLYLAWEGGWAVLLAGALAILAALAYTGGPFPLGYHGLGEVFAFLFFGPVALCGTVYVQLHRITPLALWASLPVGLLGVAILIVNNLRDIGTDRVAGKRTLAVLLGERATRWEYALVLVMAYLAPAVMVLLGLGSPFMLLSWGSLALVPRLVRTVFTQRGRPLNQALAGTGMLALVYAALFAVGLVVGKLKVP